MECRVGCGACCTAPSIREPLPGMPDGKPAGVPCVHLTPERRCGLWGRPERPAACVAFEPEPWVCGASRGEALRLLGALERDTAPTATRR